jgi:HPt (histidine-containing phosphotransfer) domain-containing protein
MDRVGGDARLLAEISGTFPDACAQLMSRAREAMQCGDAERFACEVHTLRGMFRSLSGIAAEDETRKLEELDPHKDREKAQAILASLEHEVQVLASELSVLASETLADGNGGRASQAKKTPANAGAA